MSAPLAEQLFYLPPRAADLRADDVLDRFLDFAKGLGLTLYPAQEEAILEIVSDKNVILNTPTGSGKSLVATAMHFLAMARGERSYYTCPIKALVSEKFFALCKDFGPENVGMMTGDASVNRDAPILCCTAEILANIALREGKRADVKFAILDEFHFYADRDRGVAWQIPLLALPQARFLLMSATLGPTERFEEALTKLTGAPTVTVRSADRPVPLDYTYAETPLHETILDLVKLGKVPIYVVNFTQRACAEEAQNLMSTDYSTKEEKRAITEALHGMRFDSPYGKEVQKFVKHGVGIHHAGLLPKYRRLVERLAQRGMLKVICGTDTLGVGVNVPIRTVLFTKLCKFDGEKTAILTVRDFQQIAGRAGRRGFDAQGSIVAQAPEHVIENLRLEAKAGSDPGKRRKIVKKKPPEKGYVHWDRTTFDRLVTGSPEPLVSRFSVSHGMLLNVLARDGGEEDPGDTGCKAMARLIKSSHERLPQKRALGRTAMQMFTSLKDAGVIEVGAGRRVRVNTDLQEDFSLNHALSLYLVETIEQLERELPEASGQPNPAYALDLLTLVESILENPEMVLMRQLDKIKTEKMAEMKAAGVEYEERIAELDKLDYPKPNKDFVYDTFNAFAKRHPWLGQENIRPKSIAREMFETFATFGDYVKDYGLERGEGILLRYLSDAYKTLVQSVPSADKTAAVDEIVTYLGAIVRAVDSSLLDEWEKLRAPDGTDAPRHEAAREVPGEADITFNPKELTVLVRNALFAFVRALARRDYAAAAAMLDGDAWKPEALEAAIAPFWTDHTAILTDARARSPEHTRVVSTEGSAWRVEQVIADAEDANDWAAFVTIDLARSRDAARPVIALERLGELSVSASHQRKHVDHCLNCGAPTPGAFCSVCGQEAIDAAVTFRDQVVHFVEEVVGIESRLPRTVKLLLTRPGELTRAYNAGQRVRYVTPLKLYLFASVAFFLVLSFSASRTHPQYVGTAKGGGVGFHVGPTLPPVAADGGTVAPGDAGASSTADDDAGVHLEVIQSEEQFDDWLKKPENAANFPAFLVPHLHALFKSPQGFVSSLVDMMSKATLALVPIHALLLKILYWRRRGPRRFYGEHIVFSLHLHSFAYVLFGLMALVALVASDTVTAAVQSIAYLGGGAYSVAAARTAYGEGIGRSAVKMTVAGAGYTVALIGVLLIVAGVTFLMT